MGGLRASVPAVRETALEQPVETARFVDDLCDRRFAVVVFMTGVGAALLLREAEGLGKLDGALTALRGLITVCRGPKPVAVLRRNNVQIDIVAAEPHTTAELVEALDAVEIDGKQVALVHYGERNDMVADRLRARGRPSRGVLPRTSGVCLRMSPGSNVSFSKSSKGRSTRSRSPARFRSAISSRLPAGLAAVPPLPTLSAVRLSSPSSARCVPRLFDLSASFPTSSRPIPRWDRCWSRSQTTSSLLDAESTRAIDASQ